MNNTQKAQALQTMLNDLVDHKITKGSIPPITAAEYEYLWAQEGIYVRSANRFWMAQIQIASFKTPGLVRAGPNCFAWNSNKDLIPGRFLHAVYEDAHKTCGTNLKTPAEALYRIQFDPQTRRYELVRPEQVGSYGLVSSAEVGDENTAIEIHSHHVMATRWSQTDDNDHQGLRLYGLIGDFDKEAPMMRLRLSIHGHRLDVPVTDVFNSNTLFVDGIYNG